MVGLTKKKTILCVIWLVLSWMVTNVPGHNGYTHDYNIYYAKGGVGKKYEVSTIAYTYTPSTLCQTLLPVCPKQNTIIGPWILDPFLYITSYW